MKKLKQVLEGKKVLLLVPGRSVEIYKRQILDFVEEIDPLTISINFIPEYIRPDYLYISNKKRYQFWSTNDTFLKINKIITSNFPENIEPDALRISFSKFIKCGAWDHSDNSTIMALRLLDIMNVECIFIAGFDGYDYGIKNYYSGNLELPQADVFKVNKEIDEMFVEFIKEASSVCVRNI